MIIEQLAASRSKLLNTIKASIDNKTRAINDAEADSKARFEKLRKELEDEYTDLKEAVYEALGKPETAETKTESVSEIIT